jgi:predicted DNA-binding transcriptional regulator YafY
MSVQEAEITQRTYRLIKRLLKNYPSKVDELARHLDVSQRVVYRMIKGLKEVDAAFEDGLGRGKYQLSKL